MNVGLNMLLLGFEHSHFPTCYLGLSVFYLLSFPTISWPRMYEIPSDSHSAPGSAGYYHQAYRRFSCLQANHLTIDAKPGG